MSADGVTGRGSRPSNGSNPAQGGSGPDTPNLDSRPADLPTPRERVRELWREHPDKMRTPVSVTHGRKLREEALSDPETEVREVEIGERGETRAVEETVAREALPVAAVVDEFLSWYESYRGKQLRLARGDGYREPRESFTTALENSYSPEYQEREYAQLQALRRQTAGGELPSGEEVDGEFEEPVTVLLSLTSSGVVGDTPRPPADHARSIREAWSGSSSSVKRTLRYVLEDKLGLDSDEYAWWWQAEPHPGDGDNAGYSHAHPVVVLDGAAAAIPAESITDETFRAVVAKHVSECEGATMDAHRLDDCAEVKAPDELEDFAGYVSEYLAVSPDEDLLERSSEYILWAATQWASTSQKYSKSKTASAALAVDRCRQRARDPETTQDHDHGEEVRRVDGEVQCAHCGESWAVEAESVVQHRLTEGYDVGSDGDESGGESAESDGTPEWVSDVDGRWEDARAAAAVGEEVREVGDSASWSVAEGTEWRDPPEWRAEAVVQGEEERVIGQPDGVDWGRVVVEGAESITAKIDRDHLLPSWVSGARPWERHPVTEHEVRSGALPPPELVRREHAELSQSGRRVTPKRWHDDWYARRHETEDRGDGGEEVRLDDGTERRVRELAERSELSPVGILGRLVIDPSHRAEVERIVEAVRGEDTGGSPV